jgi:hypothetical protein
MAHSKAKLKINADKAPSEKIYEEKEEEQALTLAEFLILQFINRILCHNSNLALVFIPRICLYSVT